MTHAELAKDLLKRQFLLPIVPKDDEWSVFVRFWLDNFDVKYLNGYNKWRCTKCKLILDK